MSFKKKVFFTSDLHIGHKNCLKFDNRPFQDLNHMEQSIIKRFNNIVPPTGITYFLGDIGFHDQGHLKSFLSKLNGTKILIVGNHDKGYNSMYDLGFDVVMHSARMEIAGEIVTLSHYPLRGVFKEDTSSYRNNTLGENWHREAKYSKYTFEDEGQYHLHGHLHGNTKHNNKMIREGRQWDIGVVGNNYTPVSVSQVESWIVKHRRGDDTDF